MATQPGVSVCTPVYNGATFLAGTMRSVLDQTYRDVELVVLDNNSQDASGRLAREFDDPRVRIEHNATTTAQPDHWHRAVELCRAPLVKLVCAGDLLHPRCLEYQVAPMMVDPGLAVVAARRYMIDENSRVLMARRGLTGVRSGVDVARQVVRSGANPIGEPCSVLFRRDDYVSVGGWRADQSRAMDLDLWMRLLECGEFLGLPETLAAFRVARKSLSADDEADVHDHRKAVIAELAASPHWRIRGRDQAVGRLHLPWGHLRRRTSLLLPGRELSWGETSRHPG